MGYKRSRLKELGEIIREKRYSVTEKTKPNQKQDLKTRDRKSWGREVPTVKEMHN